MQDYLWLEKYTVLDKSNEKIIKELGIQPWFHPYFDVAKNRIQKLVNRYGTHQDAADTFLDFLEEEYEYIENED
ncbi:hypothetical protein HPT25_27615 [Bacillus sp. BRMEA1]|uniref:hypothetical protein n=1 Tax=Neobacillus endophyticus TaxID=2738405 RepID=UPI0015678DED|nr:hypothetical protein [Neobacillus endophyticus]NRD81064.1 hypothetical protein [Neobacillus endophyticus]